MKISWQGKRYWIVVSLVLIFSFILRIPNINRPLLDAHYFRQTQTATVARNFYRGGIDFFHTKLDIFGDGKEQVLLLEFPLYQSVVTLFSRIFGFNDFVGRFVSLLFAVSSAVVLVLITNKLFSDKNIALVALVFFIFNPLNFYFQQAFMIESTVIFLHLFSLYLWMSGKFKTAAVVTSLAFIHKNIYAPFLLLPILAILFFELGKKKFLKFQWLPGILLSLFILFIWQYWVNILNFENGHSNFITGNTSQLLWNFGTLSERLNTGIWLSRLSFIQNSVTKYQWPLFLAGLVFLVVKKEKSRFIVFSWLAAMVLYYLTLFRIQSHDYYFMPVLPVFGAVAGYGLVELSKFLKNRKLAVLILLIYLSLFTFKAVSNSKQYFKVDDNMRNRLDTYNSVLTGPGNILFVFPQYDWNSVYTYYTGRKGKVFAAKDISLQIIRQHFLYGYKYAVIDGTSSVIEINRYYPEILNSYHNLLKKDDIVILEN